MAAPLLVDYEPKRDGNYDTIR